MKDRMLVAIGLEQTGIILAHEGDSMRSDSNLDGWDGCRIDFELVNYSYYLQDHFLSRDLPEKPGLYVWEGRISYTNFGAEDDGEASWNGSWRPATYSDLVHFKIELPEITQKDI